MVGIAAAALLAFIAVKYFGRMVRCADSGMQPQIESGSTVLVNTMAYNINSPKRGEIVVVYLDRKPSRHPYVRRIAGLPGETVQISDGELYINGKAIRGGEYPFALNEPGIAAEPITLGSEEYFVLGSNTEGDEDSRASEIGNVKADEIIGEVWFCIEAGSNFGFIR